MSLAASVFWSESNSNSFLLVLLVGWVSELFDIKTNKSLIGFGAKLGKKSNTLPQIIN